MVAVDTLGAPAGLSCPGGVVDVLMGRYGCVHAVCFLGVLDWVGAETGSAKALGTLKKNPKTLPRLSSPRHTAWEVHLQQSVQRN